MGRTTRSGKAEQTNSKQSGKSQRRKKRSAAAVEEPVHDEGAEEEQAEEQQGAPDATATVPRTNRREQMAEIAQRYCSYAPGVAVCWLRARIFHKRELPAALQTSCPLRYVPDRRR